MKSEASRSTLQYIRLRQNLKVVDYVVFQDEQVYLGKVWILTCTSGLKGLMSTRLVKIPTHGNNLQLKKLITAENDREYIYTSIESLQHSKI